MTLENSLHLPEPIVNAIRSDDYTKGECDYSVTELIKPVRIVSLTRKWSEHLIEDVSDRIFSLFGRAVHTVLEKAGGNYMVEKRFFVDFTFFHGQPPVYDVTQDFRISCRIDVFDTETGILSDYKFTSRYTVADGVKPEHEQQLNCNAFLMCRNGIEVNALQIVAIFRDWSKMAASRSEDYPQKQVAILPVKMWPMEQTEAFIRERIKAHQAGQENPPVCTPEERWRKPDKFALMKKGNKRAVKLYESREEVERVIGGYASNHYIEPRPGEDTRCLFYCDVNKYCSYYQQLMQEKVA